MSSAAALIRRTRMFNFHARYLWRFHRIFVRRHLSRRCAQCIASEAHSPLDENGICPACREASDVEAGLQEAGTRDLARLEQELDALLRSHVGSGDGLHDALIMFSGGKDSTLLAYEIKQRYPELRLLALTIDNSYMSPVALDNAREAAAKLDIDYIALKPAKSLFKKSFRYACTAVEEAKGCFETVDRIDADIGFSVAKIHAAMNRIPLIITGLSWKQVKLLFGVSSYEVPQDVAMARVDSTLGRRLSDIYSRQELAYWWDPARFPEAQLPRFIHPLYVWRFEESEIQRKVIELGLIIAGNDSPLVTNNVVIPMMICVDYHRLGYASFEPEFAEMVRDGKSSRLFWRNVFEMLEYSAKTGWMLDRELDRIAASLDLTRQEIGLPSR